MKPTVIGLLLYSLSLASPSILAAPPNGKSWVKVEQLSDEFNGVALNLEKWYPFNPKWRGRPPSQFDRGNVVVRDGRLSILTTKPRTDMMISDSEIKYLTGTIKSRVPVLYGYFEMKGKIADSRVSSAFWLYDHSKVTWTELDIFELCGRPPCSKIFNTNAHAKIPDPTTGKLHDLVYTAKFDRSELMPARDVVAGLEWDRDWIRWYVNGKMVRELKNYYWHSPLYIVVDSEVFSAWFGDPEDSELPAEFSVEYVRTWRMNPQSYE